MAAVIPNALIYVYTATDGHTVPVRFGVDTNGIYQLVFDPSTSAGDQALVTGLSFFNNMGYAGVGPTVTLGPVIPPEIINTVSVTKTAVPITLTNQISYVEYTNAVPITQPIPLASSFTGRQWEFKNGGSSTVTLDATAGGQILVNGVLQNTLTLNPGEYWQLTSDGTSWMAGPSYQYSYMNTVSITLNAIGVTSTDGLLMQNTTAAAVGAPQWSPRLHFIGQSWNTTAVASQTVDWIAELETASAATTTGALIYKYQVNAGGYNSLLTLDSALGVTIGPNSGTSANATLFVNAGAAGQANVNFMLAGVQKGAVWYDSTTNTTNLQGNRAGAQNGLYVDSGNLAHISTTLAINGAGPTQLTLDPLTGTSQAGITLTGRNGGVAASAGIFASTTGGLLFNVPTGLNFIFEVNAATVLTITTAGGIIATGMINANNLTNQITVDPLTGTNSATILLQGRNAGVVALSQIQANTTGTIQLNVPATQTYQFQVAFANVVTISAAGLITTASATLIASSVALTNNAAGQAATMTNGPTAGNPTKWIPINDNGTTRNIPAW